MPSFLIQKLWVVFGALRTLSDVVGCDQIFHAWVVSATEPKVGGGGRTKQSVFGKYFNMRSILDVVGSGWVDGVERGIKH